MPADVLEPAAMVEDALREVSKIESILADAVRIVCGRHGKRSSMIAVLLTMQSRKRNTRSSRGHFRR